MLGAGGAGPRPALGARTQVDARLREPPSLSPTARPVTSRIPRLTDTPPIARATTRIPVPVSAGLAGSRTDAEEKVADEPPEQRVEREDERAEHEHHHDDDD